MKDYDRKKPVISIHIPKCAGTTLREVLQKWYGKKLYPHYFDTRRSRMRNYFDIRRSRMPKKYNLKSGFFKQKFKEGVCIHGHFNKAKSYGPLDYYPEIDQFFTFLREPFELRVSLYFHAKRQENKGRRAKQVTENYRDVNDYLSKEVRSNPYILNFMPYEMTMDNYKEILDKYFIYIGLTEDMQTSVNVLAARLGFPPTEVGRLNTAEYDEEISTEFREELRCNQPLEYAIYEYALNTYNKL
jgi:hypothetical protein